MLALGVCLYCCARRGRICEVISINEKTVEVERGRAAPTQRWSFQRAWARVILERSALDWYPGRLTIRSHGREVSIGGFLREDEREQLARALADVLGWPPGSRMSVR